MKSFFLIPCICGAFSAAALAQSIPSPFLLGGEYQLEADTDDGGSFSRAVAGARVSAPLYLGEDFFVALTVAHQFESFDFDGFADDPWDELHRTSIGIAGQQKLANGWSWIALAAIDADYESGADIGRSITGGVVTGAWYEFNDTLKLGLGVSASSRLERKISVIPFPIIDWDFAENWAFTTAPPDGFNTGPGVSIRWDGLEDFRLSLVYQFQSDRQRLDDSAAVGFGDRIDGVGEFRQSRVALVGTYLFDENLSLSAHAGVAFGGEIEIRDSDGDSLDENDFDSSLVFGIEGTWSF